jgi:drug/metabolite transporter (DMT)-like permease
MAETHSSNPPMWRVIAAFAAVYIIWGSTYLAIRFAIDTLPPFLMAGLRFLIGGAILYAWTTRRGAPHPTRAHWKAAIIIGALLLLGGNGLVTWSEQRVPSGMAALIVAIVPLWMVVLDWLRPGGVHPGAPVIAGVIVGLVGVVLLVSSPADVNTNTAIDPLGALMLILATLCWAVGSLYSRGARLPASPLLTTSMEMLAGGVLLTVGGTVFGEWGALNLSAVSLQSFLALIYLIVFGSIIAFSAYGWLLRVTTPARAATYAYVNPVVAVFLGWALAGEDLTARTLVAAAIIIGSVVIITVYRGKGKTSQPIETSPAQIASENA